MKASMMLATLLASRSADDRSLTEALEQRVVELEAENKQLREALRSARVRIAVTDIVREVYRGGD